MNQVISLGHRLVGEAHPAFVIAEAGVNHNGDVAMAEQLVIAAREAGADCVKFQTFKAERVVTSGAPKAKYQTLVTDPQESQLAMLRKLELSENAYGDLIALCKREGLVFTSTPYNEEDVDFLDELDVPLLKAASIHLAEPRFLQRMAETGRPLLISTGMADWDEVRLGVEAIRSTGNENFVLLQCTTNYPSLVSDTNLRAMVAMRERFNCLVGYSDHTQSHVPCIGARALGACVIEKHLTLDRSLPGPDHSTSETPGEFAELVASIRTVEVALGSAEKFPSAAERANMQGMRRSIVARRALQAGVAITDHDLTCKRPATGIPPRRWSQIVGTFPITDIAEGQMLDEAALACIRPMASADTDVLEQMLADEPREYMAHFTAFSPAGTLTEQFRATRRDVFRTVEVGGRVAGFYCLRGLDAGYERPAFGLYIGSTFSGAGLGRLALVDALQWCRDEKIACVMLKVAPANVRARKIYANAGFVEIGVCPDTGHTMMQKEVY